jgi:rubrerythrin
MIYPFNASEAFKIAISIEENGLRFYNQAADKLSTGPVAELFRNLAKEEEIHKAVFKKMFEALPPPTSPGTFDPENETDQYLQMMASFHVFKQNDQAVDQALSSIKTEKEALKLAMNFEKDSVVFFVQLKNASAEIGDKVSVDSLISEEAGHLRKLAIIYNRLP